MYFVVRTTKTSVNIRIGLWIKQGAVKHRVKHSFINHIIIVHFNCRKFFLPFVLRILFDILKTPSCDFCFKIFLCSFGINWGYSYTCQNGRIIGVFKFKQYFYILSFQTTFTFYGFVVVKYFVVFNGF